MARTRYNQDILATTLHPWVVPIRLAVGRGHIFSRVHGRVIPPNTLGQKRSTSGHVVCKSVRTISQTGPISPRSPCQATQPKMRERKKPLLMSITLEPDLNPEYSSLIVKDSAPRHQRRSNRIQSGCSDESIFLTPLNGTRVRVYTIQMR